MRRYSRSLACGFFLMLAGCKMLEQGVEDCRTTSVAVKTNLGVDTTCSFETRNGHTTVTLHLKSVPAGEASALKTQLTEIARRSFRSSIDAVVLVL